MQANCEPATPGHPGRDTVGTGDAVEHTTVQRGPRLAVDDAWAALNRRYAIGAAVLAALLAVGWLAGWGPGGDRGVMQSARSVDTSPASASSAAGAQPGAGGSTPEASSPAPATTVASAPATSDPSSPPTASSGSTSEGGQTSASGGKASPAPLTAAPSAPAKGASAPSADATPSVRAVPRAPVARLYFEPDQAWVAGKVGPVLAPVLARLKAEPDTKALVSGYHDGRGSAERNAALALRRAKAVRRVLIREGVPEARIVLAKPQRTQGNGADRDARRVDVTVAR